MDGQRRPQQQPTTIVFFAGVLRVAADTRQGMEFIKPYGITRDTIYSEDARNRVNPVENGSIEVKIIIPARLNI